MDAHPAHPDDARMSTQPEDPAAAHRAPSTPAETSTDPPGGDSPEGLSPQAVDARDALEQLTVDDTDSLLKLAERVGALHDRIAVQTRSEVEGLFEILGSKRRLLFVNFMSGLARGAGFFLGVTLVGGLLIGGLAFFVDTTTAAMGMEEVTFRSLMRTFAEEAIEAKKVWEDVNREEALVDPVVNPKAMPENQSPPPPIDDG
jgi:hypothetical protein